ncbi:MAG: carbohydrate-binding family 9-like protein [Candidatus Berkelbacteria bacterium]|nr:carbohydrate-binding family 9-like protein [Candidatus Berkelbacteria bacterium]
MTLEVKKTYDFRIDGNSEKSAWQKPREVFLVDSVTGKDVEKKCRVRALWSEKGIYFLYEAEDDHIWGTYKNDDDPIYNEEVVEVFIAQGGKIPKNYFEFQFSPNGVKFDAKISNPTGNRHDKGFDVSVGWDCEGLKFAQSFKIREEKPKFKVGAWWTEVFIDWKSIGVNPAKSGSVFCANFFRIDGYPKQNSFQSWIPTLQDPPNFHVSDKFGYIKLI